MRSRGSDLARDPQCTKVHLDLVTTDVVVGPARFTSLIRGRSYRFLNVRRILLPLAVLALVLTACSGDGEAATTTAGPTTTQEPDRATTSIAGDGAGTTTSAGPDVTTTLSDRPLAPDFTLELGDGGSYTLSEGAKPVYLVFWAEW